MKSVSEDGTSGSSKVKWPVCAELEGKIESVMAPQIGRKQQSINARKLQPLVDPSSGCCWGHLARASLQDADLAAALALDVAQGEWGAYSALEREALLLRLVDQLVAHQQPLAELESLATGRAIGGVLRHGITEAIAHARFLAGLPSKLDGHAAADQGRMDPFRCSFREPRGVAVLRLHAEQSLARRVVDMVSALAAGCPLIILCEDATYPLLAYLRELLLGAGAPAEVVSLLAGDEALAAQLLAHDGLFVPIQTPDTGIAHGVKVTAEASLSTANSRMLIFDDADIDQVVDTLQERVLSPVNPGVTSPRIHCHAAIYDELLEAVTDRMARIRCGPALAPSTQLGPFCNADLQQLAERLLQRCRHAGIRVIGGEPFCQGRGLTPALLADDQLQLAHESLQMITPLLLVQPFGYEDRIVRRANRDRQCQGVSLFTQQLGRVQRLSRGLRSEQIWVNGHFRQEPGDHFDPLAPYLRRRTVWIES